MRDLATLCALIATASACGFDPGIVVSSGASGEGLDDLTPSASVALDCDASFDSTSLSFGDFCGQVQPQPVVLMQADGSELVALATEGLTVTAMGRLRLVGDRVVALAIFGDAVIDGVIDASATGTVAGPGGGDSEHCSDGNGGLGGDGNTGGGGGGGGFGTSAAAGGAGNSQTAVTGGAFGVAGMASGDPALAPLRGGCSGGHGGADLDQPSNAGGAGGGGGGGVWLHVSGLVQIRGTLAASGGGGQGGSCQDGGGGGGAGGALLVDADRIELDGAHLVANGGGGGEGGANQNLCTTPKASGQDGQLGPEPASGGAESTATGGDGGSGASLNAGAMPGAEGSDGTSGGGGGGGGGGAVGRIRLEATTTCTMSGAVLSPAASGNGASGCP